MVGEADAATCYRPGQGLSVSNLTGPADDRATVRAAQALACRSTASHATEVGAVVTAGAPGETAPREQFVLNVETKVEASSRI
jgi:hypothetical protein